MVYAVFSGLLLYLSFPGAAGYWPLAWVALVPMMLAALRAATPRSAARLGFFCGLIHYLSLLYWILIVLGRYGGLAWWVTLPVLLLLACYMSGYFALFAAVLNWAGRRSRILWFWLVPLLWVGLDFIRARIVFNGFPWQDLAYSQYRQPLLLQIADLFGHHGLTFLIVLANCLVAVMLRGRPGKPGDTGARLRWMVMPAILLIAAAALYSLVRFREIDRLLPASPAVNVVVVQGNIEQDLKWSEVMRSRTLERYLELSQVAGPDPAGGGPLIIWPESALPYYLQKDTGFGALMKEIDPQGAAWLLTGAPYYEQQAAGTAGADAVDRFYNSAFLVSPAGQVRGRYDKQHLVPFGEYIPLRSLLPLPGPLVESIGDFNRGGPASPLSCQQAQIGVLICFESIFPELARCRVRSGANLLVNITNDAWFGRSSAPWQHLSMAVLRAVETRRSLARSANTGISGFIDPLGRLPAVSPLFESARLAAVMPLLQVETFFAGPGYYFAPACLVMALLLLVVLACRQAGRQENDGI